MSAARVKVMALRPKKKSERNSNVELVECWNVRHTCGHRALYAAMVYERAVSVAQRMCPQCEMDFTEGKLKR